MRITKRNAVLLAAVVLLSAITWFDGRGSTEATESGPLLTGVLDARILELSGSGGRVTLQLEGEQWTVGEAGGFPAYQDGVQRLLQQLAGLRANDVVAENRASFAGLGLTEADAVRVRINENHELEIGAVSGATYVCRDDEERAFRALGLVVPSLRVESWIDSQPFLFDPASVDRIALRHPDAHDRALELERHDDGSWSSSKGKGVSSSVIADWLQSLSSLVVDRVEPAFEGTSRSVRPALIEVFAGEERLAYLDDYGAANDAGSFVYNEPAGTSNTRLLVSSRSLDRVRNGARALFAVTEE